MHETKLWQVNYSRDWLIKNKAQNKDFIFFWRTESCFSQWHYSEFESENKNYNCAEQYMMAEKARLFEDLETESLIMAENSPRNMKILGRKIRNFDEKTWVKFRYSVVVNGNLLKFEQNPEAREVLLSTDSKILVEASPMDIIWGIGYSEENPKALEPENWRGLNLLGFALMETRDLLNKI